MTSWKIATLTAALAIGTALSAASPASALPLSTGGNDLRAAPANLGFGTAAHA